MVTDHRLANLWEPVEGYLAAEGLELDDIELSSPGKRQILRVLVDADSPVEVDRLGVITNGISRILDGIDVVAGPYYLEVSSPGLERKLRRRSHYAKSIGRDVIVRNNGDRFEGVLTAADDEGFEVESDGVRHRFQYDEVSSVNTSFKWERAPKPGKTAARRNA